jgi:hypothetical protein
VGDKSKTRDRRQKTFGCPKIMTSYVRNILLKIPSPKGQKLHAAIRRNFQNSKPNFCRELCRELCRQFFIMAVKNINFRQREQLSQNEDDMK